MSAIKFEPRNRCLRRFFNAFGAALLVSMMTGVASAAAPCESPTYRQFDFWLGEWEVRTAAGMFAGTNRIVSEYGGCVVHERYDTGRGYSGESLNTYDPGRKLWHQTWVDSSGGLLLLEGGLRGDSMVLEGQKTAADGKLTKHRISWTPQADGRIRQLWETAAEDGAWSIAFNGIYKRK